MYLAKQSGKGHHEVFQPGMRQDMIDRLEMRAELAEALARDELRARGPDRQADAVGPSRRGVRDRRADRSR